MKCLHGCLIGVILSAACVPVHAQEVKGMVKERPASGLFVETGEGFMVPYTETIPGTGVTVEMVPIPGGEFMMGSPEGEADRGEGEGPRVCVVVGAMWVGKYEVTWGEYKSFMAVYEPGKKLQAAGDWVVTAENEADAVTIPTPLYEPAKTFERGWDPREPAVTMTPYAARQYTKWLSLISGRFYRLPSEAEWEYFARAGTETAFSFGDDPAGLDAHGWYFDNSIKEAIDLEAYRPVGMKPANGFGLHDVHGNVSELVLDEYREGHYAKLAAREEAVSWRDAVAWPENPTARVHRGGSWDSDPADCRSAARGVTDDKEWKIEDPNFPKSPWWYTEEEARAVGFRIVRPLEAPSTAQERGRFWEDGATVVRMDTEARLKMGRALRLPVGPGLPEAVGGMGAGERPPKE